MSWINNIAGCFGSNDLIFVTHQIEEDRAFALLEDLRKNNVSWSTAKIEFRKFLTSKAATPAHRNKQLRKVAKYYQPWLR